MTDADKRTVRTNPLHVPFGSDPSDIRIRINPDSNPGSLLLEILDLAGVLRCLGTVIRFFLIFVLCVDGWTCMNQ